MYKLCFYVPVSHLEQVKAAVFTAGAGHIGNYDSCSWQSCGSGQFRPLAGAAPFIGETGSVSVIAEYRVEMVCDDSKIQQAVAAMKAVHPYEIPAYDVWQLADY